MRVVATILDSAGLLKGKQRLLVNLGTGDRCEKLKRKPQLKLEWEGLKKDHSHPTTHRQLLQTGKDKSCISKGKMFSIYYPSRREIFSLPGNSSANEQLSQISQ